MISDRTLKYEKIIDKFKINKPYLAAQDPIDLPSDVESDRMGGGGFWKKWSSEYGHGVDHPSAPLVVQKALDVGQLECSH